MNRLTYRAAGVDIGAGEEAVRRIAPLARRTFRREVIGGIGGFAGFVRVPPRLKDPVLVSSTDGVGTKLRVAFMAGRHDSVGVDLVAMSVNDVLVHGAEPLYFLDYISTGRLDPAQIEAIVSGVVKGCLEAGCALIGGETAELPGFYPPGEYDLAGFAVGVAERKKIVDGSSVRPGDVVLGLASSGLHSNGYSLARRVVFDEMRLSLDSMLPETNRRVGEVLLEPTRIYVTPILALLKRLPVRAMAHITGGGIPGNLPRVLPKGCRARISRSGWKVPPVFEIIQRGGRISDAEMFRTFNMGIGYVLVVSPKHADEVLAMHLPGSGERVLSLGEVVAGARGVELVT